MQKHNEVSIVKADNGVHVANFDSNDVNHNNIPTVYFETSFWAKDKTMHFLDSTDEMITPLNNSASTWHLIALEFQV